MKTGAGLAKRIVLEGLGWLLLVAGVVLIFAPGPGLLALFAGMVLLSRQYDWADKRVEPVRLRALNGAAESVETVPRILASCVGVLLLAGAGVLWIVSPPAPEWWVLRDSWWLLGGMWTGIVQVGSAVFAAGMLVYSYWRFNDNPEARALLAKEIEAADESAGYDHDEDEDDSEAGLVS